MTTQKQMRQLPRSRHAVPVASSGLSTLSTRVDADDDDDELQSVLLLLLLSTTVGAMGIVMVDEDISGALSAWSKGF